MIAVLTADLIDSTNYSEDLISHVIAVLKDEFAAIEKKYPSSDFTIYRGDSFQGVLQNPEEALFVVLQLKTAILKISTTEKGKLREADLRIAIGIGSMDYQGSTIEESNGQAFQFSGRSLDEMKDEGRKTRLKTPNESINGEFEASFFLLDEITDRWSTASAEVIYFLLKGLKEKEIARELNISQSAVNQRKKAAGWEAINSLLVRYKDIILKTFFG
ncbi:SatD family protein [Salegentibacter sp. F14]